ncbi:MAG: DUF1292 domain-containing protein [Clostridiales bacterium]|jgi:uncharacterized protein YrzB (UPF0473 family)|nr:DUF1292 domain-containing protein [Clostridiales bacterium]
MNEHNHSEDNGAVEIFDTDTVITLFDDDGNPIEFYEIASVEYGERFYELLRPVEPIDGIGEDEAVIFEYEVEDGTTDKLFKPIYDETLLSAVFDVYLRAAADCECGCGDGCDCCR